MIVQEVVFDVEMFNSFMKLAIEQAKIARSLGEIPVGALILNQENEIIARGHNLNRSLCDPTAHAEIIALRKACVNLQTDRLIGCSIYVTLEPCPMCASAISFSRISNLYYGASDPKSGGVELGSRIFSQKQTHFKPNIFNGFCEKEINRLMTGFFQSIRQSKKVAE